MVFIHLLSLFASLPSVKPKSVIRLFHANDRFGLKRITITITQLPLPLLKIHSIQHKSSRRKTKQFSSYFRFPTSHTTVRAVRHTAVPILGSI